MQYYPNPSSVQAISLSGELSFFSFIDIIQMIANGRKSGHLRIYDQERWVHLSFINGELVDAVAKNLQGEDAFYSILEIKEGRFEFRAGVPRNSTLFSVNITWLLLEALRRNDEAGRLDELEESSPMPVAARECGNAVPLNDQGGLRGPL
jgi:hypothetical protein